MTRRHARNDRKTRAALEPRGERLDARELLSGVTAVVTNTLDVVTVGGTLRDAIAEVDASPSPSNSIVFDIPKSDPGYNPANGTFTINLVSALPDITNQVLLDGTSESTFLGEPALVVIDGAGIKGPADGLIVAPSAPASVIEGVEVANFDGTGIITESSSNTIGGAAQAQAISSRRTQPRVFRLRGLSSLQPGESTISLSATSSELIEAARTSATEPASSSALRITRSEGPPPARRMSSA